MSSIVGSYPASEETESRGKPVSVITNIKVNFRLL